MSENSKSSPHILGASASLLGFCFVVLTSLKVLHLDKNTYLDEIAGAAILFFMSSCLLSFLSLKSKNEKNHLELAADIVFIVGLVLLFATTVFITFDIVK